MDTENLTGENLELIYYIDALAKIFCSGKHWGGGEIFRHTTQCHGKKWSELTAAVKTILRKITITLSK